MTGRISFAEFELDAAHRRLYQDGEPVPLYAKTFDLLEFFVRRNGHVVSKNEILETVWKDQFVEESNLSVQVSALRRALGEKPDEHRILITVPGKGYKFVADVSHREQESVVDKTGDRTEETETSHHADIIQPNPQSPKKRRAVFAIAGLVLLVLSGAIRLPVLFRRFDNTDRVDRCIAFH